MDRSFEGLRVWQQSRTFVNDIYDIMEEVKDYGFRVTGGQVPRHRFLVTCEAADETLWKIASGREVYLSKSETPLQAVCGLFQTE